MQVLFLMSMGTGFPAFLLSPLAQSIIFFYFLRYFLFPVL